MASLPARFYSLGKKTLRHYRPLQKRTLLCTFNTLKCIFIERCFYKGIIGYYLNNSLNKTRFSMPLATRLNELRKKLGLSQQAMADIIGVHVNSWKKYENSQALPSLDALKKIATTLHVSTDYLLFDEHERGGIDTLALQFEAVSQLTENEQAVVREVLESLIIRYQSRRWDSVGSKEQ
jgi:transcriptional regulator with XRE-family HTH domain